MGGAAVNAAEGKGIYRHPTVWNGVADARVHRLPSDGRLLRDVKLAELPKWAMARHWAPIDMWYAGKRMMMRSLTQHQSTMVASHRFTFFQTKILPVTWTFRRWLSTTKQQARKMCVLSPSSTDKLF